MRFSVLLGAGSSLPAGYPSTKDITEHVLSGVGVRRHSDLCYYIEKVGEITSGQPMRLAANRMVRRLHSQLEQYFSSIQASRSISYEDLFYLADQLHSEELGAPDNAAVHRFSTELQSDTASILRESGMSYREILNETRNYMADIVWGRCQAGNPGSRTDHLAIFEEYCRAGEIASISTLCHDTHVEGLLRAAGISLVDGFGDEETGVRYWNGDFLANGSTPFLKLHGSVDWFRFRPDDSSSFYDDRIGIPLDGDHQHTRTPDGSFQTALDERPFLLIGTFNKISEYSRGIFRDLHYAFRSSIRHVDGLIVCGYSFGDKGVNSEIINWVYGKRRRRLVVIDPESATIADRARPAIGKKWKEWTRRGIVTCINKNLECVSRLPQDF